MVAGLVVSRAVDIFFSSSTNPKWRMCSVRTLPLKNNFACCSPVKVPLRERSLPFSVSPFTFLLPPESPWVFA